jgi:zinc/manganese transport system permease protein
MIDQVVRLLAYDFAQNAIAAGIVIAIVSGVVSRFVVARNMAFASTPSRSSVSRARREPSWSACRRWSAAGRHDGHRDLHRHARGSTPRARRRRRCGHGVRARPGRLFLTLYPRYATEAFAILFGTITGVTRGDVLLLVGIGIATLLALGAIYRPLTFATVDPEVAEARGVPVRGLAIAFLLIMAAAVAEAVQVVGVLLILTLLITPGAAAERLTAMPGRARPTASASPSSASSAGSCCARVERPVSVYVTSPELRLLPGRTLPDRAPVDRTRRVNGGPSPSVRSRSRRTCETAMPSNRGHTCPPLAPACGCRR